MRFLPSLRRVVAALLLSTLALGATAASAHGSNVKISNDETGRVYEVPYGNVTVNGDNSVAIDSPRFGHVTVRHGTITYSDHPIFGTYYSYQAIPIDRGNPAFRSNAGSLHVREVAAAAAPSSVPVSKRIPTTQELLGGGSVVLGNPCAPYACQFIGGAATSVLDPANVAVRDDKNVWFFPKAAAISNGSGFRVGDKSFIVSHDGGSLVSPSGGTIVAAGAGNLVASGAGNLVASGAGNFATQTIAALVAAGAGNLVASGAGNLVASGAGNLVASGAGNLVATGAGNVISNDGGTVISNDGGSFHVMAFRGSNNVPAEINACTDARISLAYYMLHGSGGSAQFVLGNQDRAKQRLCDPALYDGGRVSVNAAATWHEYATWISHAADCSATPWEPEVGQALFKAGASPQSFAGACDAKTYLVAGARWKNLDDLVGRVNAHRSALSGPVAGPKDAYGCASPSFGVAVFAAQQLFFGSYQNVPNLDLSKATAFTCSNAMPSGLYRGDPNAVPTALQVHPPTVVARPVVAAPLAPAGPLDRWGCAASDPAIATFALPSGTELDLAATPNLDLSQAKSIACRSKLPAGSFVNPNLASTRFMNAAPNPAAQIKTTQTAGSTSAGLVDVRGGWIFNSSPGDLSSAGLVFPNAKYDTMIYPDGKRHDLVGNTGRLQGFASLGDLLSHRAGNPNPICDRPVFVLRSQQYAERVPVANRSDVLAYQCANDLTVSGRAQGITYTEKRY